MRLFAFRSWLPVLGKELVQQAAQKRTYLLRVLYAGFLFLFFCLFFHEQRSYRDPFAILGSGKEMFEFLVVLQFAGIYVLLPAMMAGALTREKERDSLSLLFLTRLGPWEIVLQKYLGRLVPMFTCLLLALPLLAICYAFGGITTDHLGSAVLLLLLACLQVGALALMFSSFCRTTLQAFVCSYVFLGLFYFGPALVLLLLYLMGSNLIRHVEEELVFAFIPQFVLEDVRGGGFATAAVRGIPAMGSTVFFLVMARVFLLRRAFVSPRSQLLSVFKRLDAFWYRANKLVGGIVLIKERDTLPTDDPIAWREVTKKSLGKVSYMVRIVLSIGVPVVLIASAGFAFPGLHEGAFFVVLCFLWSLAVLTLVVASANTFVSERTNQTLDLLLATPLSGAEIVRQKARGTRRLALVMVALILLVDLLLGWARGERLRSIYAVSSVLAVAIYLPMFSWVSLWIGLKAHSRTRAVMTALVAVVLWCVLPFFMLLALEMVQPGLTERPPLSYLFLLSPASIIAFTVSGEGWELFNAAQDVPVVINYVWHGVILMFFRLLCLSKADDYLGRAAPSGRTFWSGPLGR